jgi:putative tricarboxylic transport membrane protein
MHETILMTDPQSTSPGIARPLTRNRIAGLALVGIAAAIAWESVKLPLGSIGNPGAGFLPLVLAAMLAAFGVLVALLDKGTPTWRSISWQETPRAAGILATTAFGAYFMERFGYRATTFAMVAFLLLALERKNPLAALTAALVLSAGTYYLFADLLKTPLPIGPWGW